MVSDFLFKKLFSGDGTPKRTWTRKTPLRKRPLRKKLPQINNNTAVKHQQGILAILYNAATSYGNELANIIVRTLISMGAFNVPTHV